MGELKGQGWLTRGGERSGMVQKGRGREGLAERELAHANKTKQTRRIAWDGGGVLWGGRAQGCKEQADVMFCMSWGSTLNPKP
eukprot:360386-Chlamydomonas_euryale.AAC.1